jgi:hypothetical protein
VIFVVCLSILVLTAIIVLAVWKFYGKKPVKNLDISFVSGSDVKSEKAPARIDESRE